MTPGDRAELDAHQLNRLNALIEAVLAGNAFYGPVLRDAGVSGPVASLDDFRRRVPPTSKQQLVDDQAEHPPFGTNLSFPLDRYTRYHQTSGTTGRPLRWLDTPEGWSAMLDCWERVFAAAGIGAGDRVCFTFSFGPFLGFWTAFEAAARIGCLCVPAGGMSTAARLRLILDTRCDAVCCTPTYALHLAAAAGEHGIDLTAGHVRRVIVAGEPGGSVPAVRARIETGLGNDAQGCRVFDHHGLTEVGPVSHELKDRPGTLAVIEPHYLAELVDPDTLDPVDPEPGAAGELLLTTLSRVGSPLLRYRTGDLVRVGEGPGLTLDGGVLARVDDMVLVRGNNVFPSAVDQVVRSHAAVAEYRVAVTEGGGLTEMRIEVEPTPDAEDPAAVCRAVELSLRDALHLRVPVRPAAVGALPRFEMKANRWVRHTRDD